MRFTSHVLRFVLLLAMACAARAQRLSALAEKPDWTQLEVFHETITREEFARLLETVYAPEGAALGTIEVAPDAAVIKTALAPSAEFRLRFAADAAHARKAPRSWRTAAEMGLAPDSQPLAGVKIALDPGHLGGEWAKMEERWFQVGDSSPVVEGEMTLRVAIHLAVQLRALGAEVSLVREQTAPITLARPASLRDAALAELALHGVVAPRETYDPEALGDLLRGQTVQWQSELLFYRVSEIRARAQVVNERLKPDLVLCLHFNGEGWGDDPRNPQFVPRNHLHILVNGCYSTSELRFDDQRFDLLQKLLNGSAREELASAEPVAAALAAAAKLPPYEYTTPNARRVGAGAYVWARNLLANRLYHAPVIFLEPYVMNSDEVWARVQAGDYEGERLVLGVTRKSIFREYAGGVAAGLAEYYRTARPAAQAVPK